MNFDDNDRSVSRTKAEFNRESDSERVPAPASPADIEKYRAHLRDMQLTEEQETELLRILFEIMRSFVELGFEYDVVKYVFGEEEIE